MQQLTPDQLSITQLRQVTDAAEILDEAGQIIGYFTPASASDDDFYARAIARVDPDEIARRKADNRKGSTTAEILARLKAME